MSGKYKELCIFLGIRKQSNTTQNKGHEQALHREIHTSNKHMKKSGHSTDANLKNKMHSAKHQKSNI